MTLGDKLKRGSQGNDLLKGNSVLNKNMGSVRDCHQCKGMGKKDLQDSANVKSDNLVYLTRLIQGA